MLCDVRGFTADVITQREKQNMTFWFVKNHYYRIDCCRFRFLKFLKDQRFVIFEDFNVSSLIAEV